MAVYPNGSTSRPIVSDPYGMREHPIYHDFRMHWGTDSYGHPGGKNYACEAGTVVYANDNGNGAGKEIRVQSAGGRQWRYKHNASYLVNVGDVVKVGQALGVTGTTGDSTGVHCHLELWINGASTDPYAWIASNLSNPADLDGKPFPKENNMARPTIVLHVSGANMAYIVQQNYSEIILPANEIKHLCKVQGVDYTAIPVINDQDRDVMSRAFQADIASFARILDATLDDEQAQLIAELRTIQRNSTAGYEKLSAEVAAIVAKA